MYETTKNRLEAIQKLQPPKTPKGCRSFAGVVNPQMDQGRAGSKRKKPDPNNQAIKQPSNLSKECPRRTK